MERNSSHVLCHEAEDVGPGKPAVPAVMFSVGVVGNAVALVLLGLWRTRTTLYHILVRALLTTDLLGSVSVSPVVLCAYAWGKTLLGMSGDMKVCVYFGFSMTFLTLSTLGILCVMALERVLSIGHPYLYERHLSKRAGLVAVVLIYGASVVFCVAPFVQVGKYVQYCPGTWCFLELERTELDAEGRAYVQLYASIILLLISSTVLCNITVIVYLVQMYKRRKMHRRGMTSHSRYRRSLSMTEEVEHLLPLAIITVVFMACTIPLVIRVHTSTSQKERDAADLRAMRLLSVHSIINPWVFIILRPATLKTIWRKLGRSQNHPALTCMSTPTALDRQTRGGGTRGGGARGGGTEPPQHQHEETHGTVEELHPTTQA
ncbi:prostaglandin E receptor 2b subtype EP2 [Sphaeramia orbicularis]|uniref:Prostaglandin E2 receptor EP2 subtype-like n=1 Tax=Sphaeramia orbicularis TaxID=375764 RepID=A0A672ZAD4_9TELE|nr:prostaglandin E2 receptor EP2 subtype-like [Sphaeramia orbicularis]